MFNKIVLPMVLTGAMVATPAMANSFDYGLGNASVKSGGNTYSGLTYNLGANIQLTDSLSVVLDYASGDLEKSGQTDIDYSSTYVGMRFAVLDLGDGALTLNLGNANVDATGANIDTSGTRYGMGFTSAMSETSTLSINVERDKDADLTFTSLDLVFAITESLDMNISAVNTTDHSAYSLGLSHQF